MRAKYRIVKDTPNIIKIKDVGKQADMSITNDAEAVVQDLVRRGLLTKGKLLFYIDSNGDVDEILHDGKIFVSFNVRPRGVQ